MSIEETQPSAPTELAKAYDPSTIEEKWADYWVEKKLFDTPAAAPGTAAFTILLPPPNVTGVLHIGHMLEHTEMDILTRWHRMSGETALWVPGTDHAGIATQLMVEKQLAAEGKTTRAELGREAFVARVWEWKQKYGSAITDQMRRLGDSVDWSREYFTMDDDLSHAVTEAFVRLHEQGLIYRGAYIVNWDPVLQTAVSDLEVESEERTGKLYSIRYPLADGTGSIVIATTRPETLLGDTAVAVNPTDPRYQHLIGKTLSLPLTNREIPIVADEWANPEFGTGAVKVTPAHDPNDFAIGKRHDLPSLTILDKTAHIDLPGSPYHGLDRFEARKQIVAELEAIGLLVEIKDHAMTVPVSQRSGSVIEPRLSDQWFLAVNKAPSTGGESIAAKAIAAVREGHIKFTPDMYEKTYQQWMENIHDWCLSRQLWWGHRIPAWYCANRHITVSRTTPTACPTCASTDLTQETDVLDTWFSSGMLPFTVFGWPKVQGPGSSAQGSANLSPGPLSLSPDLASFYPTDLLVTGFDILFFWVARMIMLGTHFMQEVPNADGTPRTLADSVPFREVYIHALVRDADRQKMSKTKGNVIDPIEIITKYGTDAVRFTLASQASPGTDIAFNEARTEGYRAFANKIWNAARFLFMNIERAKEAGLSTTLVTNLDIPTTLGAPRPASGTWVGAPIETQWIFDRLSETSKTVDQALKDYRFDEAANAIYQFFWGEFCDWYLELVKVRLDFSGENNAATEQSLSALVTVYEAALRMLSPFMPFITEEIWHVLYAALGLEAPAKSIALTRFPQHEDYPQGGIAATDMTLLQEVIVAIRGIRKETGVPEKEAAPVLIFASNPHIGLMVQSNADILAKMARVSAVSVADSPLSGSGTKSTPSFDVQVVYERQIDVPAERERLTKDLAKYEKGLQAADKQLGNKGFMGRAPAHIVEGLRKQHAETLMLHNKTKATLEALPPE
ncbi:valine--tRNA ligase [Granulicella tundricola]|uniref:Valine--tRNA ligase n=1 Tax=Granulicella tundricola (strain ATCC BAA-1859 / DSM 23138 / MP5ACTX9) TaxID=1198114 RepID=E8X2S6_GRATM|nr:valine--tRNA ligase [Granulicella tundricola]ADW70373.1 valyl-tRNA synthetase [Granulicella tundricola MP5ACTX9]